MGTAIMCSGTARRRKVNSGSVPFSPRSEQALTEGMEVMDEGVVQAVLLELEDLFALPVLWALEDVPFSPCPQVRSLRRDCGFLRELRDEVRVLRKALGIVIEAERRSGGGVEVNVVGLEGVGERGADQLRDRSVALGG